MAPKPIKIKQTVSYYDWLYERSTVFEIQLVDYLDGEAANNFVQNESQVNQDPGDIEQWVIMKFNIKYISGSTRPNVYDVISEFLSFYNYNTKKEIEYRTCIFNSEHESVYGLDLYHGNPEATFYVGFLVDKADCPITIRLPRGYNKSSYEQTYTWFTTK